MDCCGPDKMVSGPHANKKHKTNVESAGNYAFYALVAEVSGKCHGHIDALARYLAQFVDSTLRKQFKKEFRIQPVSTEKRAREVFAIPRTCNG
jgi:hypothetical protein